MKLGIAAKRAGRWLSVSFVAGLGLVACAGSQPPAADGGPAAEAASEQPVETEAPAIPSPAPIATRPVAETAAPGGPDAVRLGVGDVLEIEVFGLDELDRKARVFEDGTISMPLLGSFEVAGLTLPAAEERIAGMLRERRLVNDPQVSIFVEEFSSRGVSVQGAVNEPGIHQMLGSRSLLDMIGEAGGFAADRGKSLFVMRRKGDAQRRFEIDIDRLIEGRDFSLNIFLEPGDLVMVPQARMQRVYVTGAVARPGAIEFSSGEGITVLQAITAAGGPTERANLRKVSVSRRLEDGSQKRWQVNVKAIQNGKEDDFVLVANDTVVVAEWLF